LNKLFGELEEKNRYLEGEVQLLEIVDNFFRDFIDFELERLDRALKKPLLLESKTYKELKSVYEQLKALAEVARQYKIIMLSDEIYGELNFNGTHRSIARHYPEGTIISSGLSKWAGAGGWRLGTFTFPAELKWLLDAMAVVASETFTSTSAPIQYAAVRAFKGGADLERYLFQSRRVLKALSDWIWNRLSEAGVTIARPDGAFYMFPDFEPLRERLVGRGIVNGEQLCARLLQDTGVAILPGNCFGRPDNELTARMAFVDFDGAKVLAAAAQIPADEPLDEEFLQ